MERESFEDLEVAEALNRDFICIKVDKEERPDIDAVYMGVCQALTGSGGWPLSIFMTADQRPFFAGTYFPKHGRYGQSGLLELTSAITQAWGHSREKLLSSSDQITAAASSPPLSGGLDAAAPDHETLLHALHLLRASFDPRYGGFGRAPKFPTPHHLLFLLRCHQTGLGEDCLAMARKTLGQMALGGIHDHIGGGFSRYSTDARWLAPHFEKMLYDNALLAMAYTEAHQIMGDEQDKRVVTALLGYIQREMTHPAGGFYSAQDADSHGEEGRYYTFSPEEIQQVLGAAEAEAFCRRYDVTPEGNFEGKSIPNLIHHGPTPPPSEGERANREKLYHFRLGRCPLHKDDKVLTSWNALMIAAYCKAYGAFGEASYLEAAQRAFAFILKNLAGAQGELRISWRDGKTRGQGLLEDYAFMAWAALELYQVTFDSAYLAHATQWMERVQTDFSSPDGGFFLSPTGGEALLFRPRDQYDGAVPSGNSVALHCLLRLSALTGEPRWREAGHRQLDFYAPLFAQQPTACTFALCGLMQVLYPTQELVCAVKDPAEKSTIARELGLRFLPGLAVLVQTAEDAPILKKLAPFSQSYQVPDGKHSAFYLCQNQSCSMPVDTLEQVLSQLEPR